ncbi:hypothetical protein JG688_00013246 [Phytophthora aleatoria]|uniref:Uncharacterized protein n=1 Tax=Phytophthora aleatoria TaxID=2496075 RepID=A0A8J5IJ82_9STRA|nr:hypothetical protein JG688_00013246 [Phytophthora aleatoria]
MFVQVALVALAPPLTDHASQRRISLLEDELRRAARNYETLQHDRDRLHETTDHLIDEQRGTERFGLDQASVIAYLQAEIDVQQLGASNAPATGADQQIGDLRAQVTQHNTELHDLDRRLDRAHRDLDGVRDRNQVLERELDLAGSEIDILCTQISNQEREIDDLRDTLATSDYSLIRVRDALRASANALAAARSDDTDLTALRSERDTFRNERDVAVASSARLEGGRSSPLVPARSSPLYSKGTGRAGLQFLGSQHQGSPDRDERNQPEIIEIQDEGGDHGEPQGTDQSEVEEIQDDGGDQYEYDDEEDSDEQGADKLPASDVESQALSANAFDHDQAPSSDSDGEIRAALARSQ